MKTNYYTDLVADYLSGNLSEAERADFEARLETDPELAAALTAGRRLEAALRRQRPDIRAMVEAANAAHPYVPEDPPGGGTNGRPGNRWWLWSGLLALFIAAVAWFFLRDGEPQPPAAEVAVETAPEAESKLVVPVDSLNEKIESPPELEDTERATPPDLSLPKQEPTRQAPLTSRPIAYADFAKTYMQEGQLDYFTELSPTLRGGGDQANPNQELASVIAARDPADLLKLLDTMQNLPPQYLLAQGMAHFELAQYRAAADAFSQLASISSMYQQDAQWYLVLSRLALLPKQRNAFDRELKRLRESKNAFAPLAEELARRLAELEK